MKQMLSWIGATDRPGSQPRPRVLGAPIRGGGQGHLDQTVIATTTVLTFVNQRVWADAVLLLGSIGDPYRIRRRHCTHGARHPYCLGRLSRRTRAGTKVTTHLMP